MTVYQVSHNLLQRRNVDPKPAQPRHYSQTTTSWLQDFVQDVDEKGFAQQLSPVVWDLEALIESSADLRMLASAMFDEIPDKSPYREDPVGQRQVRGYTHMLHLFNAIVTEVAPTWNMAQNEVGLLGVPFTAVLAWPMATPSGYAFFLRKDVNEKLKDVLNAWRDNVLMTSKSRYVLTTAEDGWLCKASLAALEQDGNAEDGKRYSFSELFVCTPTEDPVHWGFRTWDGFFTRQFRDIDKLRPVGHRNKPEWVVSACESRPYALQTNVKGYDSFWLKGSRYSVTEMLDHHELAEAFIGGTVFQSFLAPTSYHRWCAPVSGHVVDARVVDGTYFSQATFAGFSSPIGPDPSALNRSQGYITQVATRALIFIRAQPPIGLMCAMFVGMSDVSSCDIAHRFRDGLPKPVYKGEELGTFRHGGSSNCLLFRKGLGLAWVPGAMPRENARNVPVRSALAYGYTEE